jgi:hypothetical protein
MTLSLSNCPIVELSQLGILRHSYRVQRTKVRPGTVVRGGLLLPPPGLMTGRFDVPGLTTGYFATTMQTALLESVARRTKQAVALADLRAREMVCLKQVDKLKLLDLRGQEHEFPDLVSERYGRCQRLASEANEAGLDGVIYASAQHPDEHCFTVFEPQLHKLTVIEHIPLVVPRGKQIFKVVQDTLERANLPLQF